jgi:hypothetical protein
MIRHNGSVRLTVDPCTPRPSSGPYVSPQLERAIAARWRIWVPWVRMHLLRTRQSDPSVNTAVDSPESRRLRLRHSEHILDMMREGMSMRTIRRHRLDDPRITDEVRAVLLEAAKEQQSKAWYRRPEEQRAEEKLATLIRLSPIVGHHAPKDTNNGGNRSRVRQQAPHNGTALHQQDRGDATLRRTVEPDNHTTDGRICRAELRIGARGALAR